MVDLPQTAWIGIGFIAFASALAMLHALSATVQNEQRDRDLKLKVTRLRSQYRTRLAEAEDQEVIIVDEVSDEPAAAAA